MFIFPKRSTPKRYDDLGKANRFIRAVWREYENLYMAIVAARWIVVGLILLCAFGFLT